MMRYYNENPQVVYWRKKYEELNTEYLKLLNDNDDLSNGVAFFERQAETIEARVKEVLQVFNSLPWYKKMFFKLKV